MAPNSRIPCSIESLVGTWIPYKSEIPDWGLGSEIYHFTADQIFIWELLRMPESSKISRHRYELADFTLTYRTQVFSEECAIEAWFDGNSLIFCPSHGYKTYSRKQG